MAQPATIERHTPEARQPLQRQSAKRIGLRVMADWMAILTGLFIASAIRFEFVTSEAPARGVDYNLVILVASVTWLFLFRIYGLYEPRQVLSPVNEFKQVFHGVVAGTVLIVLADSVFRLNLSRSWELLAMGTSFALVGGERLVIRKLLHMLRRRGGDVTRTIVVGVNQEATTIARTLEREAWLGYRVIGFLDQRDVVGSEVDGRPVLGSPAEVRRVVAEHQAGLVLVAASALDTGRLNRLFWELQEVDVDLQVTAGTIDLIASRMAVQSVAGVPLFYVRRSGMDALQLILKRTVDIVCSALALLVLSPALIAIAVWIKVDSPGPAFFRQVRVGRDGRLFRIWKFRTMVQDAERRRAELEHLSEGPGLLFKLKEDPRVTKPGRWLRKYSLDELPQLFNVLRGEMSLVGPRPALPTEVEQYDDWIRNRLKVKPGMTGLWQVSGRTETSFSDYVRYDLFYIQNWSLSLDAWILWRTLRAVRSGEGAA